MEQSRIPTEPLQPALYNFSPAQRLLIKSRLFLYREGLGSKKQAKAWRRIAQDISLLAEFPGLAPVEKTIIEDRFRYYLLTQSRRGWEKPVTEREIADAAFYVGKDPLQRWFMAGKTGTASRQSYQPAPQIIAAIRDFLVAKRHLSRIELEVSDPSIALAYVLNEQAGFNADQPQMPLPEFYPVYRSYAYKDARLHIRALYFEPCFDAGYIRFFEETQQFPVHKKSSLEKMVGQAAFSRLKEASFLIGWVPFGILPALVAFLDRDVQSESRAIMRHITLTSVHNGQVKFWDWRPISSYSVEQQQIVGNPPQEDLSTYIHSDYAHIIEYFQEGLHADTNKSGIGFSRSDLNKVAAMGVEEYSQDELKSGKALYDEVRKIYEKKEGWDYDAPAALIAHGANVNYWDEELQCTTLHLAATIALVDTLDAMMAIEDLNYRVKNKIGMTPADMAFRVSAEYGMLLTTKQTEQAHRGGVDMTEFMAIHGSKGFQDGP